MPKFNVTGPDGKTYSVNTPEGASQDEAIAYVADTYYGGGAAKTAVLPDTKVAPTAPVAQPMSKEEGFLSAIGRAAARGVPNLRQGAAKLIEDYPEIVGAATSALPLGSPIVGRVTPDFGKLLGKVVAESDTYKGLTGDMVAAERSAAEKQLAEIGPRKYSGVFEEKGIGRKIGSLAETVAESALPVGAGVAAGLVTRNPVIAGTVMGAGNVPTTYGGIRERQQVEGIDDVQRAVIGTVVASALDVLTGIGGKVLSGTAAIAARELLEAGLKQAAIRIAKAGGEEAATEMLQSVVEQVAGGANPATKKAMLETLESGLAGGLGGTVFTGATEVVAAPFRPNTRTRLRADRELARQARAAGIDLDDKSIGATYNALVAKLVSEGMREDQALIQASRELPRLIGVAPENLGEVPGGAATTPAPTARAPTARAPTARAVNVNQPTPLPEDVRTPLQEVTPEALDAALPIIDNEFESSALDFEDEYGVTELTPEVRQAAAEMIVAEPNLAPYDALHSVLQTVQQAAPTTTAVPTATPVTPILDMSAPLKERTAIAEQLVADVAVNDEILKGLGITEKQQKMAKNQFARGAHPDAVAALTAVLSKAQLATLNVAPQPTVDAAALDTGIVDPPAPKEKFTVEGYTPAPAPVGAPAPQVSSKPQFTIDPDPAAAAPQAQEEVISEFAPTEEAAPIEEEDQFLDDDEHPLMVAHETKFDAFIAGTENADGDLVGGVDNTENTTQVRDLAKRLVTQGVLDEDDYIALDEAIKDAERGEKFDTAQEKLAELVEAQRDNQRYEVEDNIREEREAAAEATQQTATAEPAPQEQEEQTNLPAVVQEKPKSSRKLEARITGLDFLFDDLVKQFDDIATNDEAETFIKSLIKEKIIDEGEAAEINETLLDRSPEALNEVKRGLQSLLGTTYNDRLRKIEREELQGQRYRREGTGKGVSKKAVQDYVNGLIANWKANLNVNVINSIDDLPANLKEAVISDGAEGAQGFVTAEGDIYILASNLNEVSDAASTIYHEGLGHLGLRALFNERLDKVLQQIYDGNKKLRDEADTWFNENANAYPEDSNPRLRALEEVLAIQSEEGRVDASIWAKLTAVIKDMGRRLGIKSNFSDSEVRAILAMAHDQIINGPRESAVVKGLRYMINAWHGGPYDFDRFSLEHIGSGEGAQVYGWGMYFSSEPSIAAWYRDKLSTKSQQIAGMSVKDWFNKNQPMMTITNPAVTEAAARTGRPAGRKLAEEFGLPIFVKVPLIDQDTADRITDTINDTSYTANESYFNLLDAFSSYIEDAQRTTDINGPVDNDVLKEQSLEMRQYLAAIDILRKMHSLVRPVSAGKLYNVNIDTDQDHMLDWDSPIIQQSKYVQERVKQLYDSNPAIGDMPFNFVGLLPGQTFYYSLATALGSDKAASKALLGVGITGNTFIGRTSGERNYVVFDDQAVAVANKYQRKKKTAPNKELLRAEQMLARSRNPGDLNQATSVIMKVQRSKRRLDNLMDIIPNVISTKSGRYMLQFLIPADVVRLAKRASPALGSRLDKVASAMAEMREARSAMQVKVQDEAYRWNKFNVRFKEGARFLSDLINLATLYNIDPRLADNAQDFLAQDTKIKAIKADAKLGAIAKNNRIKTRTALVEAVYKRWNALASPANGKGEGRKIFDMAAKAYRRVFDRQLAGMITRIEQSELSDVRKIAAIKSVKALFAEAEKIGLYFPLGREGDFWLRIGAGKDREYHKFTSQIERDLAMRERHDEMVSKGEKRSLDDLIYAGEISSGDNANTLQDDVVNNDSTRLLQGILNELDAGKFSDLKAVREQLTQMYLQTMPQSAQSAAMQRREGITGFTANTLRTFVTTQSAAASRLARLEHSDNIRNNLATAYALIQNDPEQDKLKPYVDQMAEFAGRQLAPTQGEPWMEFLATAANRATFLYMLTSLKTALINPLQLSTVGMSVLIRDYGFRGPALAFRTMTNFYNLLGTAKLDEDGNVITKYGQPSMSDGGYINDEPNPEMRRFLKALWNDGNERGAFSNNFTGDITGDRQLDVGVYDNPVLESTRKTLSFVHNFMTGAGFHTERITREVMFMSAGRLEYEKLRKAGVSEADATKRAKQKGAELTIEALFDYGQDAKPMVARGPIGRIIFQFATFTMNMSSLLIRNFYNTVRLKSSLQERRDASILFFGTLISNFMWAGATGLPLYSLFMGVADLARELFRPLLEDEDEDPRMYNAESGNPMAYASMDLWFRQWFLPNMLGDEGAQRAVEMGPISAATDLNFNASMSLNQMFFRDEQPAENVADAVQTLIISTGMGAFGGMVKQMSDGINYMLEGRGDRAAEKLMPYNFLRQPLIAARLQSEGYITPSGLELKPAEFYTIGKIIGQATGLGSTEVAEAQKRNILFSRATDKVDAARSKVMQNYGNAYLKYLSKPTDENLASYEKATERWDDYNMEYGAISPITNPQMRESVMGRAESRAAANQLGGIQTDKNKRMIAQDMLQQGQQQK